MNENASNGPATPGPEPGGGSSIPSAQSRWIGIINAVKSPLGLLVLLALICYSLVAYVFFDSDFTADLNGTQKFYLIAGLISIPIGILIIVAIYVLRGGTLGGEKEPDTQPIPETDDQVQPDPVAEAAKRVDVILSLLAEDPKIQSGLPVMEMTAPDLVVRRVSRSAMRYFGFEGDAPVDKVVGIKITELIGAMEPFMDPPSAFWADLGKDQQRVIREVMDGKITYARVPVRLNDTHPEFPNKTYVPIITERQTINGTDDISMILRILYVDVERLPRGLFTTSVWEDVIKNLDRQELVSEFRRIKDEFDRRPFKGDKDQGETRRNALNDAIQKLEKYSSPDVLDDLSKAGWFELRDTASTMQDEPQKVVSLIEKVLGPDAPLKD